MATDETPSTTKSYTSHYGDSRELEIVYRLLYGGSEEAFKDFIARRAPITLTAIPIHTDLSPDALAKNPELEAALESEPDLRLRQFLWFLRPSAAFLALDSALIKWRWITDLLTVDDLARLPWASLLYTGALIETSIAKYLDARSEKLGKAAKKLKEFPYFGTQSRVGSQKARHTKNPMVGHRSSAFPLYTQTLNDPAPPPGRSRESSDAQYRERLNGLLTAFMIIRAAERRHSLKALKEAADSPSREARFFNPYRFLQEDLGKAPDNSKQQHIDRLVRASSKESESLPWETLAPYLLSSFQEFCAHCQTLLDESSAPLSNQTSLRSLLDFFAHARRGGAHTEGGAGNIREHVFGGHHDWTPSQRLIHQEESVTGLIVDVTLLRDISMILDELLNEDAETIAERTIFEEGSGVEVLLSDADDAASEFLLEQHTSHSQLLQATLNQPLWWNQSTLSRADMRAFLTYLASQEVKANAAKDLHKVRAIHLLRLTLAIGVTPEMAVSLEVAPRQNDDWLNGLTEFSFKGDRPGHGLPLRLVHVGPLAYWMLPLKVRALQLRSTDQTTDLYLPHVRALPVSDHLGIAKGIMRNAPPMTGLHPFPRFTQAERVKLPLLCKEILDDYNRTHPQRISVAILRRFWRGQLMRSGLSQRLVDLLSDDVPISRVPSLHYATWPLGLIEKTATSTSLPLIHAISDATKIHQSPKAILSAPFAIDARLTMGAAALPNPKRISAFIHNLKLRISEAPTHIHDVATLVRYQGAFNAYSLWMALWFMIETSHRPHHNVYADWREIDPLWGTLVIKDKSNESGDKYRLCVVSPALREAMQGYEESVTRMALWAQQNGFRAEGFGLRQMNLKIRTENGEEILEPIEELIEGFNAKTFSIFLAREFPEKPGLESNFHRRLIVFLLQLPPNLHHDSLPNFQEKALEEADIHAWLGHWQQGTAPYHRFSSHRERGTFDRIAPRMKEIVAYLGFESLTLTHPSVEGHVIDTLRGPNDGS